jgi:hypothetical protein
VDEQKESFLIFGALALTVFGNGEIRLFMKELFHLRRPYARIYSY